VQFSELLAVVVVAGTADGTFELVHKFFHSALFQSHINNGTLRQWSCELKCQLENAIKCGILKLKFNYRMLSGK